MLMEYNLIQNGSRFCVGFVQQNRVNLNWPIRGRETSHFWLKLLQLLPGQETEHNNLHQKNVLVKGNYLSPLYQMMLYWTTNFCGESIPFCRKIPKKNTRINLWFEIAGENLSFLNIFDVLQVDRNYVLPFGIAQKN